MSHDLSQPFALLGGTSRIESIRNVQLSQEAWRTLDETLEIRPHVLASHVVLLVAGMWYDPLAFAHLFEGFQLLDGLALGDGDAEGDVAFCVFVAGLQIVRLYLSAW